MDCPRCKKGTAVLVTKDQKRKVRERRGLLWKILFFPFYLIGLIFKWFIFGKKQKYHKKQYWHCNYCNHEWKQDFDA